MSSLSNVDLTTLAGDEIQLNMKTLLITNSPDPVHKVESTVCLLDGRWWELDF
jgi:hypothetical protein